MVFDHQMILALARGFTGLLRSPRPAQALSACSDRSLLDGSLNHRALRSRLFRFESSQEHKKSTR